MPANVITDSLDIHLIFAYFLLLPPLLNLYFLYTKRRFITLAKNIKLVAPAYYFLLAVSMFSGVVLLAMIQGFSLWNLAMIFIFFVIFMLEIKRHKLQKPISSSETEAQARFIRFAKRKYALDLALLLMIFTLSFIF